MAPLENVSPISSHDWDALSTSRPDRGGRGKTNAFAREDEAIKLVKENGQAFKLNYSSPEETKKMQARIKDHAGKEVRVLTDETEPTALFIGPNEKK